MPGTRCNHGHWHGEQPERQRAATHDQLADVLWRRTHYHLQVEPTGEAVGATGDDDGLCLLLGPVQRRVQRLQHGWINRIRLAIIHRDDGDFVLDCKCGAHGGLPAFHRLDDRCPGGKQA